MSAGRQIIVHRVPPPPPNGRLVGSAVHQSGTRSVGWDVVFDAPGAASDVQAFYHQHLPGLGWAAAPVNPGPTRGGFQPTTGINSTYCQKATGPWLSVSAVAAPTVSTDVRVRVDASTPGPCANQPGGALPQPPGSGAAARPHRPRRCADTDEWRRGRPEPLHLRRDRAHHSERGRLGGALRAAVAGGGVDARGGQRERPRGVEHLDGQRRWGV